MGQPVKKGMRYKKCTLIHSLGKYFRSFFKKSSLYSYYEKDAASRGGSRRPSIDGHTQLWNSSAENIEQVSNSYTAEQGKFLGMILTL